MLKRDNIKKVQVFLTEKLSYFAKWRAAMLKRKEDSIVGWDKSGLATVTWRNTRTSICGFVEYVKYLFEKFPAIDYLGVLACTSSSLESIFSCIRALGGNTFGR